MKREIHTLSFAMFFAFAAISAGCGTADNGTEQHESHEHATYQCPMDCEAGKTYDEPGACSVCKMDLAEIEKS